MRTIFAANIPALCLNAFESPTDIFSPRCRAVFSRTARNLTRAVSIDNCLRASDFFFVTSDKTQSASFFKYSSYSYKRINILIE